MQIGKLRHRVAFQALVNTADGQGGTVPTWPADTFTVWAAVEYLAGRELEQAQAVTATVTVRIRMRFRTDVANTMRATWTNAGLAHTFQIESWQPADTKQREIWVFCQEIQL